MCVVKQCLPVLYKVLRNFYLKKDILKKGGILFFLKHVQSVQNLYTIEEGKLLIISLQL